MPITLAQHYEKWRRCQRCPIGVLADRHVFVRGPSLPTITPVIDTSRESAVDVLFIGEAPGMAEDRTGQPFVGESGALLDKWINATPAFHTVQSTTQNALTYAITNTVCCRPTDTPNGKNRPPTDAELHNCAPRLNELIAILRPRFYVLVGKVAHDALYTQIASLAFPPIHVVSIPHPSYALRQGGYNSPPSQDAMLKLLSATETWLPYVGTIPGSSDPVEGFPPDIANGTYVPDPDPAPDPTL